MSSTPHVIQQAQARELLAQIDVPQILHKLFRDLAAGQAVQPAQQLVEFPQGAGDFINYLGVLAEDGVYGVKTSPYIVRRVFLGADRSMDGPPIFVSRFPATASIASRHGSTSSRRRFIRHSNRFSGSTSGTRICGVLLC